MAQWTNLQWNNRAVNPMLLCILCEKLGALGTGTESRNRKSHDSTFCDIIHVYSSLPY